MPSTPSISISKTSSSSTRGNVGILSRLLRPRNRKNWRKMKNVILPSATTNICAPKSSQTNRTNPDATAFDASSVTIIIDNISIVDTKVNCPQMNDTNDVKRFDSIATSTTEALMLSSSSSSDANSSILSFTSSRLDAILYGKNWKKPIISDSINDNEHVIYNPPTPIEIIYNNDQWDIKKKRSFDDDDDMIMCYSSSFDDDDEYFGARSPAYKLLDVIDDHYDPCDCPRVIRRRLEFTNHHDNNCPKNHNEDSDSSWTIQPARPIVAEDDDDEDM